MEPDPGFVSGFFRDSSKREEFLQSRSTKNLRRRFALKANLHWTYNVLDGQISLFTHCTISFKMKI